MPVLIILTDPAVNVMKEVEIKDARKFRKVRKTLGSLSQDPKYPGLKSHKREAEKDANGEDIWESYVENYTPSAWRVFWYFDPEAGTNTVFAITLHPLLLTCNSLSDNRC